MHGCSARPRPAAASGRPQNMGRQRPDVRSRAVRGHWGKRPTWQVRSDGWGGQDLGKKGAFLP